MIWDQLTYGICAGKGPTDGKFRHIKVSVNRVDAKLEYRQGYFADKEFAHFTNVDRERQLEDALMLNDPITELTLAVEVNYFQLNGAEYFLPIMIKISGRELALAKKGGAEHILIDFVGEIKDTYGNTVTNLRDNVKNKLIDATAAARCSSESRLFSHALPHERGKLL